MFGPRADPRQVAPVGAYLSDGIRLIEVLESDWSGVLGEDLASGSLVEINAGPELDQGWKRIRPDGLGGARERREREARAAAA